MFLRTITLFIIFGLTWSQDLVNIPTLGQIKGYSKTSLKNHTFYAFEGVPYARPPVGKNRFREPVPSKQWRGVWNANTIYKCMQNYQYADKDVVIGDEDCLYLNIYTPNLNRNLDVLVYIHGGAFMFLHGGFQQPDFIMDKDLVYVNLNYRLGPLGFLSTEDNIVPGNNGLKDQILALEFIKTNIKHFGGNPNSITIYGMSAGGASINFHYLSPKSRNLFHRGISQSGTMLNPWTIAEKPLDKAKKLGDSLGCPTSDVRQMIDCLKRRPARQIVQRVEDFQPFMYNPFSPFGPVVDSWSPDPVLPEHPYWLIKEGLVKDVPWVVSYTNSEGLYPGTEFYSEDILQEIDSNWNKIIPHILDYNYTVDSLVLDEVSQKIRQFYLGTKQVNKENFLDFVKILSDRLFKIDVEKTIKLQAAVMKSPIFFYHFEYRGTHSKSESRAKTNTNFGAAHGDDTAYVFKTALDTISSEKDRLMVDLMTDLVASFAKTGKPNVGVEWPPVDIKELNYLRIVESGKLQVEKSSLNTQQFWESLPIKENEKLFPELKDEL